jgi:hypothetical protein
MKKLLAICCLVTLAAGVDLAKADTIYDAALDFSSSSNPTGVWSYGYSGALDGTLTVYTDKVSDSSTGIDFWGRDPVTAWSTTPWVGRNGTSGVVTYLDVQFQSGQLGFHPGPANEISIIRFISPTAGWFDLTSSFSGLDMGSLPYSTTTGVHVLRNGLSIFDGAVNGFGAGPSFITTLSLAAGDTVDFAVDWGSNGTHSYDSTGVSATLTAVPTPSSFAALIGMGLVGLVGVARRRWKK